MRSTLWRLLLALLALVAGGSCAYFAYYNDETRVQAVSTITLVGITALYTYYTYCMSAEMAKKRIEDIKTGIHRELTRYQRYRQALSEFVESLPNADELPLRQNFVAPDAISRIWEDSYLIKDKELRLLMVSIQRGIMSWQDSAVEIRKERLELGPAGIESPSIDRALQPICNRERPHQEKLRDEVLANVDEGLAVIERLATDASTRLESLP